MPQAAKKADITPVSLADAIKQAYEQADGYAEQAAQILKDWAQNNDPLYRALMDPLLDSAVWQAVNRHRRTQNRQYRTKARTGSDNPAGLKQVAQQHAQDWLDGYRLRNGLRLGDATWEELVEEIEWHNTLAATNAQRARWYQKIVERIGDKPVRHALNNDTIEQLFQESNHV